MGYMCHKCLCFSLLSERIEHPKSKKRVKGQCDTCPHCRDCKVFITPSEQKL